VRRSWTSLRARVRSLWAASVADRLDIHVTFYRVWREEDGRVWLTWDGKEITGFGDWPFWLRVKPLSAQLNDLDPDGDGWERAIESAKAEGLTDVSRFYEAVETYLDLPIADALTSHEPVVRGLAMLDRRVGKRRLASPDLGGEVNPFVKRLHELRCEAEGIKARTPVSGLQGP
jgi:hypothetical protein